MRLFSITLSILFIMAVLPQMASALPLHPSRMGEFKKLATAMGRSHSGQYDFSSIVGLDDCSGSLVAFKNSQPTDRAMAMTNGHCYEAGMPASGTIVTGVQSDRTFTLLDGQAQDLATLQADLVIYSTMTKTDITLYRLTDTYQEVEAKTGEKPLIISDQHPVVGTPINVISGYWKSGYSCTIEAFVNELHEDQWISNDSVRYSEPGCETIGGTSGSPVIDASTGLIIAINNTGNEDGDKCTMDNPCEVDTAGNITYQKGRSYAQETYWIYSCLNSNRELDLQTPGCLLFKGNP